MRIIKNGGEVKKEYKYLVLMIGVKYCRVLLLTVWRLLADTGRVLRDVYPSKIAFAQVWHITCTANHWPNNKTLIEYVDRIVVSYIAENGRP